MLDYIKGKSIEFVWVGTQNTSPDKKLRINYQKKLIHISMKASDLILAVISAIIILCFYIVPMLIGRSFLYTIAYVRKKDY